MMCVSSSTRICREDFSSCSLPGEGEDGPITSQLCQHMGAVEPCSPVDGEEDGQAVVPQQQQGGQPACQKVRAGVETCGDTAVSVPPSSCLTLAAGKAGSNGTHSVLEAPRVHGDAGRGLGRP